MKIGIVTFHRAYNFGALLQAYALKQFLQEQGYDAQLVDYMHEAHAQCYRVFRLPRFNFREIRRYWRFPPHLLFNLIGIIPHLRSKPFFEHFISEYILQDSQPRYTDATLPIQEKFDVLISGGDQIWSAHCAGLTDLDPVCFLQGFSSIYCSRVSYGSSGDQHYTPEQMNFIRNTLRNFSHIGVREREMKELLCQAGIAAEQVVDPVFLLDAAHWRKMLNPSSKKSRKTVFVYDINNASETRRLAHETARRHNAEIIFMAGYDPMPAQLLHSVPGGPREFLSNLFYADYVVTNSFHALAFSLLFQKQFWINGIRKNPQRHRSILESIGLERRFCDGDLNDALNLPPIDYSGVAPHLDLLIKQSKEFLLNSLQESGKDMPRAQKSAYRHCLTIRQPNF